MYSDIDRMTVTKNEVHALTRKHNAVKLRQAVPVSAQLCLAAPAVLGSLLQLAAQFIDDAGLHTGCGRVNFLPL